MIWNDSNTDLLLCSLLQNGMFQGATDFDQDLSGWTVSSGTNFVSLGLILVHCSFLLEDLCFWNYTITNFVIVLIATGWYVL